MLNTIPLNIVITLLTA